jgi:hypothetical protein
MDSSLLRKCNACGNEISRRSPFCRHCGHPQASPLVVALVVLFLVMIVAAYVAFTIHVMCHCRESREAGKTPTAPSVSWAADAQGPATGIAFAAPGTAA